MKSILKKLMSAFAVVVGLALPAAAQDITFNGQPNNFPSNRVCNVVLGSGYCTGTIAWDKQLASYPIYAIYVQWSDQYTGQINAPWPGVQWLCGYNVNGAGVGSANDQLFRYPGYTRIYRYVFIGQDQINGEPPKTCNNMAYEGNGFHFLKEQAVYAQ